MELKLGDVAKTYRRGYLWEGERVRGVETGTIGFHHQLWVLSDF